MMNRLRHVPFYAIILLLWFLVIIAALEVWPRLTWYFTETTNPYLLSRNQGTPWPVQGSDQKVSTSEETRLIGRGKSQAPLSVLTPEQELSQRISFFFDYEDPERYLFANVFSLHVFLLRSDGTLTVSYSIPDYGGTDTVDRYAKEADVQSIMEAMKAQSTWGSRIHFVKNSNDTSADSFGYCLVLPKGVQPQPGKPSEVWLFFRRPELTNEVPADSMWELPFMAYKKHFSTKARTGILGTREDYYINNFGFRDYDIILPKPDGVYRILCIGASTTEEGDTNDHTYPALLENLLNQHFGGNSIDVINCGISGMNAMKHRMRFPDYAALSPDMLIIYNAVNDICHQLLPLLVNEATPRQQQLRRSRYITHYFNDALLPSEARIREVIATRVMPNLQYIIEECRKRKIKVAVCSFAAPSPKDLTTKERAYYNYLTLKEWGGSFVTFDSYLHILSLYNEELRKLSEAENILYIPVSENLKGNAVQFGDICHLRDPGIQRKAAIVAETLAPFLESVIVDR
jgi:lysophospholipase L1-like esterase